MALSGMLLHMDTQGAGHPRGVVVLGATARWRYVVAALVMAALGGIALRFNSAMPLVYAVFGVAVLVNRWGDQVRLEEEALVVVHRGQRACYPWEDLLELSWERGGLTSGPVVRTVGTVWQTPGPAAAVRVAKLLSRRRDAAALQEAADRHGVPYTTDLLRVLTSGRRRAGLPTDAARTAARGAVGHSGRRPGG